MFQKKIINKYLALQDVATLEERWQAFTAHFHDVGVQENIRASKEEQYQEGFLRDLFVRVLGYTLSPAEGYNLLTELKNVKDSKKADGAILIEGDVKAVIELKSTRTTQLTEIEPQAFNYKNSHRNCKYVVISNFEKLRFYIDNRNDFEEFNLFALTRGEFERLYLCLAYENIAKEVPQKLKEESVSREDEITKRLYKDYSGFKQALYDDLLQHNPTYEPLLLFKKTQKLLDRFLFIFFAEDSGLLEPNSTRIILKRWELLNKMDVPCDLYSLFRKHFRYINEGHKDGDFNIFAYNGGLFKEDPVLEALTISDALLYEHTKRLSEYDFESEVDVNILGHIFENSLDDLDFHTAASSSKRKRDGVFYTPRYITAYIVENTIGRLCSEQKATLGIVDDAYDPQSKKAVKKALLEKLNTYRQWLLGLTICDPACGSGAFLNAALVFLMAEHHYVNELEAKLTQSPMTIGYDSASILERNLFGVDLNEESVEITKLSLWLRTATRKRKLGDLSRNIKVGNSLISYPAIAGDKAFDWQKEFPEVFAKGGFDVVIGNPPYGAKLSKEEQEYLNNTYIQGGSETVISFSKLGYDMLLKQGGNIGFIIPKSFSYASNYTPIREYLLSDINEVVDCRKVWNEVKLEQVIYLAQKGSPTENYLSGVLKGEAVQIMGSISKETFTQFGFYLNGIAAEELTLAQKIQSSGLFVKDIANNSRGGIFQNIISDKGDIEVLGGADIQREGIVSVKGKVYKASLNNDPKCFISANAVLVQRIVAHIEKPTDHIKITACYPEERNYAIVDTINQLVVSEGYNAKVLWLLLNTELLNWYAYRFIFAKAIRTMQFDNPVTNRLPIPLRLKENQEALVKEADKLLLCYKEIAKLRKVFTTLIAANLKANITKPITYFESLTFAEFTAELSKQKRKLSLEEQTEWMDFFEKKKQEMLELQTAVAAINNSVNTIVYKLYGLSEEEVKLIEEK